MFDIIKQQIYKPYDLWRMNSIKDMSMYEYKIIAKKIYNLFTIERCAQNDFYYNAYHMKKYCGLSNNYRIKAAIEHGVYLDDGVWDLDINHGYNNIITLGEARKEILKNRTDKNIVKVGPYIAYAESFWNEEKIVKEKVKNGKTLTVFPSHSTTQVDMNFDIPQFIKKIREISAGYDTIVVCMYWKDVLQKKYEAYEKEGFKIVSAGHMFDPQFLPRLKTIILLSDMIMANDFGSFIGQATYFDKPCYLYKMDCNVKADNDIYIKEYMSKGRLYKQAFDVFNSITNKVTEEQYAFCNYVWGNNEVKSKDELREILTSL